MSITATVTRTELGLSVLSLNDSTYAVRVDPNFTAGTVTWMREEVTSPFVHGAIEVNAVKQDARLEIPVLVTSASQAALQSAISTLVSAFSQSSYTLTVSFDSGTTPYSWTCKRADYSIGIERFEFQHRHKATVLLSLPRSPIAAAGPY